MKLQDLLNKCYDKKGRLVAGNAQKLIISQCDNLNNLPGHSFGEKVYLLKNNLKEIPKCPTCGKELLYSKVSKYHTYCSNKCKANNQTWKNNRKGMGFQSEEVQQKSRNSRFKKTGYEWAGQNPDTKRKIKETLEKKGQDWRNSEEAMNAIKEDIKNRDLTLIDIYLKNGETYYKIKCEKHDHEWEWTRRGYELDETAQHIFCEKCFKEKESKEEKEVLEYIKSIYSGPIIENTRDIIAPKEIDIYLPDLKLGIEYNGISWHCSKFLDKNYHLDKLKLAQENNIRLIQIWSLEWQTKKEIIKSLLNRNYQRIFARKCKIKEINNNEYKEFCNANHIQGSSVSSIRIGLFYNDSLVQIMSFLKSRMNKNYEYEMIRECSKLNIRVIGGKSKLLKYFEKTYNPKSIISYCDKRLFDGHSYLKLGFSELEDSKPNYSYFDGHKLHSRLEFQKHKLKGKLKIFDATLSEKENCQRNNLWQLYDCGNKVFVKTY